MQAAVCYFWLLYLGFSCLMFASNALLVRTWNCILHLFPLDLLKLRGGCANRYPWLGEYSQI